MAGRLQSEQQILDSFRNVLENLQEKARKKARVQGKLALIRMGKEFEGEQYANAAGEMSPLGNISRQWAKFKRLRDLDPRRGHAGGGIQKVFKYAFYKTSKGFDIDLKRASTFFRTSVSASIAGKGKRAYIFDEKKGWVRKGRRLKKFKVFKFGGAKVSSYIEHYEDQKAVGLGSIPKENREAVENAANSVLDEGIAKIRKSAARISARKKFTITLKLDNLLRIR